MNNIDKDELLLVVDKLTGSCYPYGDTHIDEERQENLMLKIALADHLLSEIFDASKLHDRPEASIHRIATNARGYLEGISDWLGYKLGSDEE